MSLEVDFVTLGDAAERLDVPPATLRFWTDQLEDLDVHYVMRNNRNERIYYEMDLKIFAFLRDLKNEYGRKTTTKDLGYMLIDRAGDGEFKLRTRNDVPTIKHTNRTADLLSHYDIKQLMTSERVQQFMQVITSEVTKNIRDELTEKFEKEFQNTNKQILDMYKRIEEKQKESDELWKKRIEERDKLLMKSIRETQEKKKGFWSKIFGK